MFNCCTSVDVIVLQPENHPGITQKKPRVIVIAPSFKYEVSLARNNPPEGSTPPNTPVSRVILVAQSELGKGNNK